MVLTEHKVFREKLVQTVLMEQTEQMVWMALMEQPDRKENKVYKVILD